VVDVHRRERGQRSRVAERREGGDERGGVRARRERHEDVVSGAEELSPSNRGQDTGHERMVGSLAHGERRGGPSLILVSDAGHSGAGNLDERRVVLGSQEEHGVPRIQVAEIAEE
jgi:hypothetical protein